MTTKKIIVNRLKRKIKNVFGVNTNSLKFKAKVKAKAGINKAAKTFTEIFHRPSTLPKHVEIFRNNRKVGKTNIVGINSNYVVVPTATNVSRNKSRISNFVRVNEKQPQQNNKGRWYYVNLNGERYYPDEQPKTPNSARNIKKNSSIKTWTILLNEASKAVRSGKRYKEWLANFSSANVLSGKIGPRALRHSSFAAGWRAMNGRFTNDEMKEMYSNYNLTEIPNYVWNVYVRNITNLPPHRTPNINNEIGKENYVRREHLN